MIIYYLIFIGVGFSVVSWILFRIWLNNRSERSKDGIKQKTEDSMWFKGLSELLPGSTPEEILELLSYWSHIDSMVKKWILENIFNANIDAISGRLSDYLKNKPNKDNKTSLAYIQNLLEKAVVHAETDHAATVRWCHFMRAQQDSLVRRNAYQEAGHTLVAYFTKDAPPVHTATLLCMFRRTVPEIFKRQGNYTLSEVLVTLDVTMGGLAAQKFIFGPDNNSEESTGLETMIALYGDTPDCHCIWDQMALCRRKVGNEDVQLPDDLLERLLKESYARAESLLAQHRLQLDALAEALLKYKTINSDQLPLYLGQTMQTVRDI